jgi:hypothetical protein
MLVFLLMFIPFKLPVSIMPTLIDVDRPILWSDLSSATRSLKLCDLVNIIDGELTGF